MESDQNFKKYNNNYFRRSFNRTNNVRYSVGRGRNFYNVSRFSNNRGNFGYNSNYNRYRNNESRNYNIRNNIRNGEFNKEKTNFKSKKFTKSSYYQSKLSQREKLIDQLKRTQYECLICMNYIRPNNYVWSCDGCYTIFHLKCIKNWANQPRSLEENWRCPMCQKERNETSNQLTYRCFCGKVDRPETQIGVLSHSCGNCCGRNLTNCVHFCVDECHPGPCPPCVAFINRSCQCGAFSEISVKCGTDENLVLCSSVCGKLLNCGEHTCESLCHSGKCSPCTVVINKPCYCGKLKELICGTGYSCNSVCGLKKSCGEHYCDQICHVGNCEPCLWSVDIVKTCNCGKFTLTDLNWERTSCLDAIPSCGKICGRIFQQCGHACERICHSGESCGEICEKTVEILCRCGQEKVKVKCSVEVVICSKICKRKLECKRHYCENVCCVDVHDCLRSCGKLLKCATNTNVTDTTDKHYCDLPCGHVGKCPPCQKVISWTEIRCACGSSAIEPPIYCGENIYPTCDKPCPRYHPCGHSPTHPCGSTGFTSLQLTNSQCPPCTELVDKRCPGGHTLVPNVPCYRPVFSCGQICNKPLSGCNHRCQIQCHDGPCEGNCTQSCESERPNCGHLCLYPCHPGDTCAEVQLECQSPSTLYCPCKLKHSIIPCYQINNKLEDYTILCTQECTISDKIASMYVRVESLNSDSSIILKYMMGFLEEFCKNNFKFSSEVETHLTYMLRNKSDYLFELIDGKKAQYIRRLCLIYQLKCKILRVDDDLHNVIVSYQQDLSPGSRVKINISKFVEDKYFKIFKPNF